MLPSPQGGDFQDRTRAGQRFEDSFRRHGTVNQWDMTKRRLIQFHQGSNWSKGVQTVLDDCPS